MIWTIDDGTNVYAYDSVIDDTIITTKVNTSQTLTIREDLSGGESGYGTDYGFDYGNPATSTTAVEQLLLWIRFSDHVHYGTKNDGTPWYHENAPTAGASTNFVLITPPSKVKVDPFYAVIEDGTDLTPGHGNPRIIETSVVWLAKESDYADRTAAKNDLEA